MNRLILMLIAMLGMVVAGCSNDDLLGIDDLDELEKLDQIENPKIKGYYPFSLDRDAFPVIIKDDNYTVYILHSSEEFAEARINGFIIPEISFKPCATDTELSNFWFKYYQKVISANIAEDFSDIDWSMQSLVIILREYQSYGLNLNKVSGKVYRKDGGFVIALRPEILFDMGYVSLGFTRYGIAVVVDKPNLSAKDLRVHLDTTEHAQYYKTLEYEKEVKSKWLKL